MQTAMAAVLLAMAAAPADAARPLAGGDAVRITPASGLRFVATVAEVEPDALVVRRGRDAETTRVPLAGLRRLEVARGRRGHFKAGALIGFTIFFVSVAEQTSRSACGYDNARRCPNVGAALGMGLQYGVMAAGVFGLAGLAIRTERWVEVPAASRPRPRLGAALVPLHRGAATRLSLSFQPPAAFQGGDMRVKASTATLALALVAAAAAAEDTRPVSGDKVHITMDAGRRFSATVVDGRPVSIGERVRVTPADGPRFSATVVDFEGDTPLVRTGAEAATTRVRLAGLRRLEVARGRHGHFKEGALIGFLPGFAFGAYAGHVLGCDEQGPGCSAVDEALMGGALVGGVTALAGGLVGLAVRMDRWEEVPAPRPRLGAVLLPVPGGAAARLAFSF